MKKIDQLKYHEKKLKLTKCIHKDPNQNLQIFQTSTPELSAFIYDTRENNTFFESQLKSIKMLQSNNNVIDYIETVDISEDTHAILTQRLD
jgi:DNA-directed RNA polymerase specialized sigma54-like protein